jgi:nitrate reductase NapE component
MLGIFILTLNYMGRNPNSSLWIPFEWCAEHSLVMTLFLFLVLSTIPVLFVILMGYFCERIVRLVADPPNTEQGGPKSSFGKVEPEKKD